MIMVLCLIGTEEKHNDHLAAHYGKSVLNAHRVVGSMYIIELAYSIGIKYLADFDRFPADGEVTTEFVVRVQKLSAEYLIDQVSEGIQHFSSLEIVERCPDLITCNIEQYKLLMYLTPEERFAEVKRLSTTSSSVKSELSQNLTKKQKHIIKLQPRLAEKMSRILLFKPVIFTSSTLYEDRIIKRSASILNLALAELVTLGLLWLVRKGLSSSKWASMYVKRPPETNSTDSEMEFERKLAAFGISELNLEVLRESCHDLVIDGKGTISDELIRWLQRPEYNELNLDMNVLMGRSSKYVLLYV
jgi:hypothetical protein